ncbi:hypothetical protein D3C72_2377490 [compost metagenome]
MPTGVAAPEARLAENQALTEKKTISDQMPATTHQMYGLTFCTMSMVGWPRECRKS